MPELPLQDVVSGGHLAGRVTDDDTNRVSLTYIYGWELWMRSPLPKALPQFGQTYLLSVAPGDEPVVLDGLDESPVLVVAGGLPQEDDDDDREDPEA